MIIAIALALASQTEKICPKCPLRVFYAPANFCGKHGLRLQPMPKDTPIPGLGIDLRMPHFYRKYGRVPADVPPNHWAYSYLQRLAQEGALVGYDDDMFRGNRPLSRGEAVLSIDLALQMQLAKVPLNGEIRVRDLGENSRFYSAVENLLGRGMASTYPDGQFRPGRPLSRYEWVVFVSRAVSALFQVPAHTGRPAPDIPDNHWAYEPYQILQAIDLAPAYPDQLFRGGRPMSRYEHAVTLGKLLTKISSGELKPRDGALQVLLQRKGFKWTAPEF